MKIITTNLLNRFWKNGVKPIKAAVEKKLDTAKVINNLLTTAPGYALDARQGKVLQDQVDVLNTGIIVMKPIDSMHDITSSTEYAYTGVSVDIPAGACYTLTAIAYYNFGCPVSVGISTSDVQTEHPKASSLEANNSASCTLSGFTFGSMKLYVWASYNNASANTIYLRGFYIIPKT